MASKSPKIHSKTPKNPYKTPTGSSIVRLLTTVSGTWTVRQVVFLVGTSLGLIGKQGGFYW
jgi:hypothetical protein